MKRRLSSQCWVNQNYQLNSFESLLETETKNSFSSWVEEQMSNFASSLALVTCTAPLTVLPAWDKVTIEETGDSGQQVILEELATFTIPSQSKTKTKNT